jgi:CheY-like chemotaxis protein
MILEHDGFNVESVLDGQLALTRLAVIKPIVVVLDLHLPNISGQEILRNIRSDERLAKTLVVAITADLSAAEEVRAEADLVLTKPFKPSILSKAIARLLVKHN